MFFVQGKKKNSTGVLSLSAALPEDCSVHQQSPVINEQGKDLHEDRAVNSMFPTIKQSLKPKISAAAKIIFPCDHEKTTVEIRMDMYRNGPAAFRKESK